MVVSDDLLRKYNVPVPRYTSYPPANHFSGLTSPQYTRMLELSGRENPRNIALYIHIPFCRKICFYCGCNACLLREGEVKPYMQALKREMEMALPYLDRSRPVSQIHYGGGTPNAIPLEMIESLNAFLFESFSLMEGAEVAIECNPAYLDEASVRTLKKAGFNRFSLGIQDFNPGVLRSVNRDASKMPLKELMALIRQGDSSTGINLDFIYGLPGQTPGSFVETIEQAMALRPDRLVTFSYAHVPWLKKHQQILEKKGLPSPEQKMSMFLGAHERLDREGYVAVGLDHFVLPEDELSHALKEGSLHRNFQGYCTRRTTGQVYAFGVSAISQLASGFSQNTKEIGPYVETVNRGVFPVEKGHLLSSEEKITGRVIEEVMCNLQLNLPALEEEFQLRPGKLEQWLDLERTQWEAFERDGLLTFHSGVIRVTRTGSLFVRNIAAALDPAFRQSSRQYSRSV